MYAVYMSKCTSIFNVGVPKGVPVCVCVCVHVYQHLFTPQFVLICKLSETIFKRLYAAHSNSSAVKTITEVSVNSEL